MEMGWEDLFMGKMAIRWRCAMEKLKPWTTKFMNLMIEWGRSCWTTRNGMIYCKRCQRIGKEKTTKRGKSIFVCPKEEALVPIENIRAMRKNMRNLPNIEIANWIAEQHQLSQKMQQRKSTNIGKEKTMKRGKSVFV